MPGANATFDRPVPPLDQRRAAVAVLPASPVALLTPSRDAARRREEVPPVPHPFLRSGPTVRCLAGFEDPAHSVLAGRRSGAGRAVRLRGGEFDRVVCGGAGA